jgi:hypothetical protein
MRTSATCCLTVRSGFLGNAKRRGEGGGGVLWKKKEGWGERGLRLPRHTPIQGSSRSLRACGADAVFGDSSHDDLARVSAGAILDLSVGPARRRAAADNKRQSGWSQRLGGGRGALSEAFRTAQTTAATR